MRSSRCISSTATALRNIFITPLEIARPKPSLLLTQKWQSKAPLQSHHTRRPYAYMITPKEAPTKSRLPRDSEIQSWSILLVEDGILSEPKNTRTVLARLDPKIESLITVAEPTEEQPLPICKIINKEEEYKRLREKKRTKKKDPGKTVKTIELNWAIDKGDLAHRLDKLKSFLAKGYKVEVVMVKKRGKSKPASAEQMEGVVKGVKGAIEEGGWKEHKAMEGKIGGQVLIFAQGKVAKSDGKEEEVEEEEENEEGEDGEKVDGGN